MTNYQSAIGALILCPIVIAVSAAFIVVKSTQCCKYIIQYCRWSWQNRANRGSNQLQKIDRSSPYNKGIYADSWIVLESINSTRDLFIHQAPHRQRECSAGSTQGLNETVTQVWHPSHASRPACNSTKPIPQSQSHYESLNVVSILKPLPVAQRRGPLSFPEEGITRRDQVRVRGARLVRRTDL